MKRYIYLTLCFTWLAICVSFSLHAGYGAALDHIKEFGYDVHSIWTIIGVFLMVLLLSGAVTLLTAIPMMEGATLFPMGFLTLKHKKIYHGDLGVFYMSVYSGGETKILVHKQGLFHVKEMFSIDHYGDMNVTKDKIKSKLDKMYKKKLETIRIEKTALDWDGYLDTQSKRDDILNKLNIK